MSDQHSDVEEGRQARHETPILTVVNADATPEEIAALVAVFSAIESSTEQAPRRRTPAWSDPARLVRTPVSHGPGGWRASGLPR